MKLHKHKLKVSGSGVEVPDETFGGDGCSHYLDVHTKTYQIVPFKWSRFLCQLYSIELLTKITSLVFFGKISCLMFVVRGVLD